MYQILILIKLFRANAKRDNCSKTKQNVDAESKANNTEFTDSPINKSLKIQTEITESHNDFNFLCYTFKCIFKSEFVLLLYMQCSHWYNGIC